MRKEKANNLDELFRAEANDEWAFSESRSVNHLTHGYHQYPAKFIPQLVKKIIEQHTNINDTIADVFAGCGTSLVESKVHGRKSIGVDVNPVAKLITEAKTTALEPSKLKNACESFIKSMSDYDDTETYYISKHSRIDYWFFDEEKNKIAFLHNKIKEIDDEKLRNFFLCALSNTFKTCSKWLQSSTKPQVDPDKVIADCFKTLKSQLKKMQKQNNMYFCELSKNDFLDVECEIILADARDTKLESESIEAIITSPPYVTSYEYADIHQLTGYWFDYFSDMSEFRKQFIGTFYSNNKEIEIDLPNAKKIVDDLEKVHPKISREVGNYFIDMLAVAKEMNRILKTDGKAFLVIGNTTLRNVKIKSAEIFAEMLELSGFKVSEVIKRKIPNKLLPTIRDKKTGRFTKLDSKNMKLVYPEEYIIIAKKINVCN